MMRPRPAARLWRRGLAVLALALAPLLSAAPEARAELLIGNLNIGSATDSGLGQLGASGKVAQGFMTGTNASGYTLESIQPYFVTAISAGNIGNLTATLRSDSSGPGTILQTLTNPAMIPAAGDPPVAGNVATFTAPAGTTLAANTTYFWVLEVTADIGGGKFWGTKEDGEESGGAAGWSIANASYADASGGGWVLSAQGASHYIRVNGAAKAANNAATGAPTISGTAEVGQTLTAATAAIRDTDGLNNVSYTYQWIRVATDSTETDIPSATAGTYVLMTADEGATIKVKVSFTDDLGNSETLTSAATAAVTANNAPTSANKSVTTNEDTGYTFRSADFTFEDDDSGDRLASVTVETLPAAGTLALSGTPVTAGDSVLAAAIGNLVFTPAANANGGSYASFTFKVSDGKDESASPYTMTIHVTPVNDAPTGLPTITGATQVGQDLTAVTTAIRDADGLTNVSYMYQWIRVDGGVDTGIPGASGSTYTLMAADLGKQIKVEVSFIDDDALELDSVAETLTSVATGVISGAGNNLATGAPTISGTAQVGQTLTAATTAIMDDDGLTNPSYTYQWIRVDGGNETNIPGASGSTYTLMTADRGATIKVKVSFNDDDGNPETLTSVVTAAVSAGPNNPATGAPTIGGTAQVRQTLTAVTTAIRDANGLDNVSYTYQWIRVDGGNETDISDAMARTYTLVAADLGKTIKVEVSFNDDASYPETLTSVATAVVSAAPLNTAATGAPTISGMAQVRQTLTAVTTAIRDANGLDNVSYTYQWIRVDGGNETDIPDATASTYTLVAADLGKTIRVKVSFTDDASNNETLTSAATAAVTAPPPSAPAAPNVSAAPDSATSLSVSWRAPANAGPPITGYDLQYRIGDSGGFTLGPQDLTVTRATIADLAEDTSYEVQVRATNAGGDSEWSASGTGSTRKPGNTAPIVQAWLARFGRAVADEVLDAVADRIRSSPRAGGEVSIAGRRIGAGAGAEEPDGSGLSDWLESSREEGLGSSSHGVTGRELLTGSSFALTRGEPEASVSVWGRGAASGFDGRTGAVRLDGETKTGLLGTEVSRGTWTVGTVVSRTLGKGRWRSSEGRGTLDAELTGVWPWGRHEWGERLSVWGLAGLGEGEVALEPEGGERLEADIQLALAASGLGWRVAESAGGFAMSLKADAMGLRASSESAGEALPASDADVVRLRMGVEVRQAFHLSRGRVLAPGIEAGVRHDGGDAEVGFGADVGARLSFSDPESGVTAALRARGLLTHEARGFQERGASGSFAWDSEPGSERGLSLALSQSAGAAVSGGADALLSRETMAGLGANDNGLENDRFEARLGYGMAMFGDSFTSTPEFGLGLSDGRREYNLGWRFNRGRNALAALELQLKARRLEPADDDRDAEHAIGFRLSARW